MKVPRLREWRERRALTQAELGRATGMAQEAISRIESGVRGCRPATAKRLAWALDVDVAELVAPPEVTGDPKDLVPRLLRRSLEHEGVSTTWALRDDEDVYAEGERLGTEGLHARLIPALRVEQKALRRIAADADLPAPVREHASVLDDELLYRMIRLLAAAKRRERTPEGKRRLAEARRDVLADAS